MKKENTWILDGKVIKVDVILTDRKTNYIAVKPDMSIEFRGDRDTQWDSITAALENKTALIRKKISFFEQFNPQPPEHRYESGETFYYIGRQYRLKALQADRPRVRLVGKWFLVELPEPNNKERIKQLLDRWFREKAVSRITERFEMSFLDFMHRIKIKPAIKFRKMNKRWGSCSSRGLLFNTELIKTPIACIDYIIVHELCHLIYPKHNKAFYRRMSALMPDWQKRKERLEHSVI